MFNIEYQPPAPPNPLTATTERDIFLPLSVHTFYSCVQSLVVIPYKILGDHLLWNGCGGSYAGLSHDNDNSDIDE